MTPIVFDCKGVLAMRRESIVAASEGDSICFTPELLAPCIYYALAFAGREECDRWQQSLVLKRIAGECFAEAACGSPNG